MITEKKYGLWKRRTKIPKMVNPIISFKGWERKTYLLKVVSTFLFEIIYK